MPEIITKYPDIVLQILRESGIECGTGAAQRILTTCPPENFCSSPTGEICIYSLSEIPQMTQISSAEIAQVVSVAPVSAPIFGTEVFFLISLTLIIGVFFGFLLSRKIKKRLPRNHQQN